MRGAAGQLELALVARGDAQVELPAPAPESARRSPAPAAPAEPDVSPAASAAFLGRLRILGLRGIRLCSLTTNRSSLVSFQADRLRIQRCFVDAPDDVLRAVVRFVNGRGAARRAARRTLLAYAVPRAAAPGPSRRRRPSSHPHDRPLVERLREAHGMLNRERFGDALGAVAIRVSRRLRARLGHYAPGSDDPPEITIGRRHLRRDRWSSVLETLVHEMVHQWQHETGRPIAHDRDFRRKAREVGIPGAARARLAPISRPARARPAPRPS